MTIFEKRVVSGLDDVEQNASSGAMSFTSGDLNLGTDGTKVQTVGIRFTGIDIPKGAIITSAYLQFQTDEVRTGATSLLIRGEDADDTAAFANVANNVSSRTTTDAAASWSPEAWTTVGEAGLAQRTPDLSAIVQEIVSRGGWSALNDMAFIITGTGDRTAESFEGGAARAPLLHIEYVMPTGNNVGSISISDVTITEGDAGTKMATFTVSRTGTAGFSVNYATADDTATANSDYVATLGTLTFAQGQASQSVSVTINGDTAIEGNETFFVNLTNPTNGGSIVDGQGLGTISNDDAPPPVVGDISITDLTITEGNSGTKTATFTVSRTGALAFTVDYATADGTATANSDYLATSGTLTFAQGQLSQSVSVTINGDTAIEPNETFFVNLTNPTNGGTILDGQGVGTISNDDVVGNISISDVTITEGNNGAKTATFTVSRTGTLDFNVDYATADGTATANSDYLATSGTLTFAQGQLSQSVSVTINGDTAIEPNETFFVNLTNPTNGGTIVDNQGLGTISNDDGAPTPSVVAIHDTWPFGAGDPSGLAYIPTTGTFFLSDSEHDESPYFSPINLHALQTDGTLIQSYSLTSFTKEPTGLAFDPTTGCMFMSDDSKHRVFWVDPANPTVKLGEFATTPLGCADPDDISVNPNNGHLFIINGTPARNIVETNSTGTQVFSNITLPSTIKDPDALVYDPHADVFYVGMKSSNLIWEVDRSGAILDTINILGALPRNPVSGAKVKIDDLEIAPTSNPNDDPGQLNLYVADYGADQVPDGRLIEVHLGDWLVA